MSFVNGRVLLLVCVALGNVVTSCAIDGMTNSAASTPASPTTAASTTVMGTATAAVATDNATLNDDVAAVIAADLLARPRAEFDTEAESRCIAERVVDAIGVERLRHVGLDVVAGHAPELTVPPLTESEGDIVYGAYDTCLGLSARDIESFIAEGLTERAALCASQHYRRSPLPRIHLLLQGHDEVPHPELHAQVEALWNEARETCRIES